MYRICWILRYFVITLINNQLTCRPLPPSSTPLSKFISFHPSLFPSTRNLTQSWCCTSSSSISLSLSLTLPYSSRCSLSLLSVSLSLSQPTSLFQRTKSIFLYIAVCLFNSSGGFFSFTLLWHNDSYLSSLIYTRTIVTFNDRPPTFFACGISTKYNRTR